MSCGSPSELAHLVLIKITCFCMHHTQYFPLWQQMGRRKSKTVAGDWSLMVMLTKHSLTHLSHIWHILVANIASAAAGRRAETHNSAIIPGKIARWLLAGLLWRCIVVLHNAPSSDSRRCYSCSFTPFSEHNTWIFRPQRASWAVIYNDTL